jgi:hypothetical protein
MNGGIAMAADAIEQRLDAIREAFRTTGAFDISPRGVRVRPDAATESAIGELRELGEAAVDAVAERLRRASDPFEALMWLYALAALGTPEARAAMESFVKAIESEGRWRNETPGLRDIKLFAGGSPWPS